MVVKRKYDIGEKVEIQTVDDNGIVCYDCEIIGCERKQIYVNGEYENVYKLQTIDNNPTFYFFRYECELDLMNPRKELSMSEFDELFDMQNILQRLESKLSEDKSLTNIDKCKIHDAWVVVKSMEEYLNLEKYKEE